jgi:glycogen phosphorylase
MNELVPFRSRTHIAYLSMEIALRPEIHSYSGGLGILAGDTARSCADLELPVVFVTLLSRQGYLRQEIDTQGRQIEHPDPWDPARWCQPLGAKVVVDMAGREVWVRPWLYVLRNPLGYEIPVLLLDTDLDENAPEDRTLTDVLYGDGPEYRLKQEIVLGIGGVRILRALGFDIHTWHMNEGHSALLALDLLRRHGRTMVDASAGDVLYDVDSVREQCVFTTHTPVEAGQDRFGYDLVERVMPGFMPTSQLKLLAGSEALNMTRLALNLSGYINGVAKRHAETSSRMFPGHRVHAITNGVHPGTWTSPGFAGLYDTRFPDWRHDPEVLVRADQLDDADVWAAHAGAKAALLQRVRDLTGVELDPEVATLGFARRMTGYKRPDLLFTDLDRLAAIHRLNPIQIVLAGKAHPNDLAGKRHIERLHDHIRHLSGVIKIVFLPNYDMDLARFITSGVDVWLNTPLPPLEASGTSGMKAALNGVLNFSVPDGWWLEACIENTTGWAIGDGSPTRTVEMDADELYRKLDTAVLPLYYGDRTRWIWMMRETISKIASYFNSQRMMRRYAAEAYIR